MPILQKQKNLPVVCLLIAAGFVLVFSSERRECAGLDSVTIQECGTLSIHACSKKNPKCDIARRLDLFVRWIDTSKGDNEPCSTKVAELKKRYASLKDTTTFLIDMSEVRCVGAADAPVTILLYVSASCPLCKKVYKELYKEVKKGKLKKIAKLGIKIFSGRPNDVALLAAAKFNRQSDLLLSLSEVKERLSIGIITKKAHEIGIPDSAFMALIQDSTYIRKALASALEGEKNGVTVTPTVFINSRRYRSYKDPRWIVDAVLFEYESLKR